MFEMLDGLSASRVLSAVVEATRIMRRYAHLPAEERDEAARALGKFLKEDETDMAIALVREVERQEGRPLSMLNEEEIDHWVGELSDISTRRSHEERPLTPERIARARATLEEMRQMPIHSPWAA